MVIHDIVRYDPVRAPIHVRVLTPLFALYTGSCGRALRVVPTLRPHPHISGPGPLDLGSHPLTCRRAGVPLRSMPEEISFVASQATGVVAGHSEAIASHGRSENRTAKTSPALTLHHAYEPGWGRALAVSSLTNSDGADTALSGVAFHWFRHGARVTDEASFANSDEVVSKHGLVRAAGGAGRAGTPAPGYKDASTTAH
jgi:hypothetical protein